jgi:penicillin G amidase
MIRRPRRFAAALALSLATLAVGVLRLGPLPPLGPFLDPANGIWSVAMHAEPPTFMIVKRVTALDSSVRVYYDRRGVPHIFARTALDAYRAMGYVVARDRLFQLDIQTRAANGTLTELVGPAALPLDRETRALGLPRAAERTLAALDTNGVAYRAVRAYAEGINAYLDHMDHGDLPFEYHLLGRRPARWQPINSIHLLNRMSLTLAHNDDEREHAAFAAAVGDSAASALAPAHSPLQEPIVPASNEPRWLSRHLTPPGAPDTGMVVASSTEERSDDIGSNNWAVSPRRTKAGYALLAGDPHLDLTLPSIWYEMHVVVPGERDVYGVTIPGSPTIVIGFNRDLAWTLTNTGADVLDEYAEAVDDSTRPTRYRVDGAWRPIEQRIEVYHDGEGRTLAVDTMRYTHRGPLRQVGRRWISTRWTALEPSDAISAFDRAGRAHSAEELLKGFEDFTVPAQNVLVADRSGTIAIRSNGRFPIRPGDREGNVIFDGSTSASDWTGDRPISQYPAAINPAQGFLASANQEPFDLATFSGYFGVSWPPPWRAMRIDGALRADSAMTPDAMRRLQTDPGSARADYFVPFFLKAAAGSDGARLLGQWDRRYTRDNQRAVLFEAAMRELARRAWHRLEGERPEETVLAELLADSTSAWWDVPRDRVLRASLDAALDTVMHRYGPPDAGGWRWDAVRTANIYHLLQIPGLSRLGIQTPGGPSTISPLETRGIHGPSWRMVVQLGPTVKAWAIYPGGQSGNPVSHRYADRIEKWAAGELDSLFVPHTPNELGVNGTTAAILELEPVERRR